ncbi:MAG: hypothetical protein K0S68_39 [Candidatus Saccharibacteria bacterium]|jgi:hypothetical protein|nr:hypothetical protein [Candidatus Saccharibacteria bacterium]
MSESERIPPDAASYEPANNIIRIHSTNPEPAPEADTEPVPESEASTTPESGPTAYEKITQRIDAARDLAESKLYQTIGALGGSVVGGRFIHNLAEQGEQHSLAGAAAFAATVGLTAVGTYSGLRAAQENLHADALKQARDKLKEVQ